MKPSKNTYGLYRKPVKKKPAKRGDGGNPMIDKLLKLKYRINDAYSGETVIDSNKSDKDFVIGLINNIRKGSNPISKIQLEECNRLWRHYRSELDYEG
jgi:hypothetical protein